ncbi:hypothetical protein GCM10009677_15290 [Sphaerisporangium rubeum]|uniref:Uncharacterized protein n=1 Tax=Sphaerisporangium rubeum TaxID=321317 RepID=A0A7X0IBV0_9ACTN|nr:hypothetical protein [Sphaerisporangium rubeum]MBB6471088.1 hypothetical protein [Sphaerisporangium rubeum]
MSVDVGVPAVTRPAAWADRVGRVLMGMDGIATLVAFAGSISIMLNVSDDRVITEAWRTFAYVVFAGLWFILAIEPRRQWGLWELLIAQKLAITVYAFARWDMPDAPMTAFIDLAVTVTTVIAYVLCRGWSSWRTGVSGR